jgi:outer membrane protein insertion porin family
LKKRNLTLALSSLILGALIGVGIIGVKAIIKKELVEMLDDMARRGAGCSFGYDRITIRLSTLKARAVNPRIVCDGRAMFGFKDLEAKFGLDNISQNEVMLKNLKLTKGFSIGATAESPTFKFIDFLVAPLPPEEDYPGRWKLRLYNLQLKRGSFSDNIGSSKVLGRGISLDLNRTPDDDFILVPKINKLIFRSDNNPDQVISKISTRLDLLDEKFAFNDISLESSLNTLLGQLEFSRSEGRDIRGNFDASLTSDLLGLPFDLNPKFDASVKLSGKPDAISGEGNLRSKRQKIALSGTDLTFNDLKASIIFQSNGDGYKIVASPEGSGDNVQLETSAPIKISTEELSGSLSLSIDSISGSGISAFGVKSQIKLSGDLKSPTLKISLSSNLLGTLNTYVAGINGEIAYSNDTLEIDLADAKSEIQLKSKISAPVDGVRKISDGLIYAKDATLYRRNLIGTSTPAPLSLSVNGQVSGPLTLEKLRFDGLADVRVLATSKSLVSVKALLENGNASLRLDSFRGDISGEINSNLKISRSNLKIKFSDFSPQEFDSQAQCAKISGDLTISLISGNIDGAADINSFVLGCEPYTLSLKNPQALKISNGGINLGRLRFEGISGNLNIGGNVSPNTGFNIDAEGNFNLHTFAALAPALDDLKGDIKLKLSLRGASDAPQFSGQAEIKNGVVSTQTADITIDDISGSMILDGRAIWIEELNGSANDGTIRISGAINLDNKKDTVISAYLTDIYLKPVDGGNIWLSGNMSLEADETNTLALGGNILIDRGEVERTVTLRSLIRGLVTSSSKPAVPTKTSELGNLKLNIDIAAPQSLFLKTNWAELEMEGAVNIGGTIGQPLVNGEIKTLNGWFGLNTKRFGITSGKLALRYPTVEPFVDITAETQVASQAGDSVLVILGVKGPLSSPKVKFSSDAGLSAQELTRILTKGGLSVSGSIVDVVAGKSEKGSAKNNFINFLKRLTDIDNLGIEPGYNERTGTVEPILVAEKSIAPRLKIIGKNSFSTNTSQSSIYGALKLSPSVSFVTGLENLPLEESAAYVADLRYAVLKSEREFLKINIVGNSVISRNRIIDGARLTPNLRINADSFKTIESAISNLYKNEGYLTNKISISCETDTKFCRTITASISEGMQAKIISVNTEGDSLDFLGDKVEYPKLGDIAAKDKLAELKKELTRAIRTAGFISGNIKLKYILNEAGDQATLDIKSKLGQQSVFLFVGNKKFKSEDFLKTINLLGRTQPFGENTALILAENIERMYREAGHLYVSINYESLPADENGKRIHRFIVNEGAQTRINSIKVSEASPYSLSEFARYIGKIEPDLKARYTTPKYAVQEEVDYFADLMTQKLKEDGYSNAEVAGLVVSAINNSIDILYEVTPNTLLVFEKVKIIGLPDKFKKYPNIKSSLSINKVNKLIEDLTLNLQEEGYKRPTIYTAISESLEINVEPGLRTKIGEIKIVGHERIATKIINQQLKLHPGDIWLDSQIDSAKRRILSLGLFSRAEIGPADGFVDSGIEDLIVTVEERNLKQLDIGAGYNSAFGPHLFSEYIDRDIFADGRSLGLRVDTYHNSQSPDITRGTISLRYIDPLVGKHSWRLTEDARYQKLENGILPYDLDRLSLLSFLDMSLFSNTKGTLGHTLMREDLTEVKPDAVLSELDNGENILSLISSSITIDRRDSALLPSRGFLLGGELTVAEKIIGSDADYVGIGFKGANYLSLNKEKTILLSNNLRLGAMFPFGDTEEIPISQRFFVGGHNTIRGFRENSIGPKGSEGSPTGGDILGYTNIELQYNLNEYLQITSFFDAGTTFLESEGLSLNDIRESAGVGTRVLTPLGAISLYAGFPLDEREGESSVRFHFNIGTQF